MEEYYFLFGLAILWTFFATIQDLKTREVANWITFSLIGFALTYRGFYALLYHDFAFFYLGVLGCLIFVALAFMFYYGRVFAGGDAKLLMGIGAILPFTGVLQFALWSALFLFLLFFSGACYSVFYSLLLVTRNYASFKRSFKQKLHTFRLILLLAAVCAMVVLLALGLHTLGIVSALFVFGIPILYAYLKSLEETCMIKLTSPDKLTEGDWLEKEVRLGKRLISRSVHGLTLEEIGLLRKAKKKVYIKEGIPFVPAFFIALVFTALFFLILRLDFQTIFWFLF